MAQEKSNGVARRRSGRESRIEHPDRRKPTALNRPQMLELVRQVAHLRQQGLDVVIVSSGGDGDRAARCWAFPKGGKDIPFKQVLAAVGQVRLMQVWDQTPFPLWHPRWHRRCSRAKTWLTASAISMRATRLLALLERGRRAGC